MTTLYGRASKEGEPIRLQDALNKCAEVFRESEAIALLYAPDWCRFGKVIAGDEGVILAGPMKEIIALEEVFEARVFNENAELRWLREQGVEGRAVLLSENDIFKEGSFKRFPEKVDIEAFDTMPQTYLLWGEGAKPPARKEWDKKWDYENWSLLAMARIGPMAAPYSGVSKRGKRIQLVAREYLDVIDEYGNVAVVEERLMKLEETRDEG